MKRLILFLLLTIPLYAQTILNTSITRGTTDTLLFYEDGNLSSVGLAFTVKTNFYIQTVREIYKQNAIAGGDSTQIAVTYVDSTDTSIIRVMFEPNDTDAKDPKKYYYDLTYLSGSVRRQLYHGDFVIKRAIFSQFDTGDDFEISEGTVDGQLLQWDGTASVWKPLNLDTTDFKIENDTLKEKALSYVAYLTQDGDPVAPESRIMKNTIGNIVWTRSSAGTYRGTLAGTFIIDKTFITIELFNIDGIGTEKFIYGRYFDNDRIEINVYNSSFTKVDGFDAFLEIRIYP